MIWSTEALILLTAYSSLSLIKLLHLSLSSYMDELDLCVRAPTYATYCPRDKNTKQLTRHVVQQNKWLAASLAFHYASEARCYASLLCRQRIGFSGSDILALQIPILLIGGVCALDIHVNQVSIPACVSCGCPPTLSAWGRMVGISTPDNVCETGASMVVHISFALQSPVISFWGD